MICCAVVMFLFAQHIAMVYPEMADKLAAGSMFQDRRTTEVAEATILECYIQRQQEFQADPSLGAISAALRKKEMADWLKKWEMTWMPIEDVNGVISEILIELSPWYRLRYYDPSLSVNEKYSDPILTDKPFVCDGSPPADIRQQTLRLGPLTLPIEEAVGDAEPAGAKRVLTESQKIPNLFAGFMGLPATEVASIGLKSLLQRLSPDEPHKPIPYIERLEGEMRAVGVPEEHIRGIVKIARDPKKLCRLNRVMPPYYYYMLKDQLSKMVKDRVVSASDGRRWPLNEDSVIKFLNKQVFVITDTSDLPDDKVDTLSELGVCNFPGADVGRSGVAGIAVILQDAIANTILSIRQTYKRDYAIKELCSIVLSEYIALTCSIQYEDRLRIVSEITGISEENIDTFRSPTLTNGYGTGPIKELHRFGDVAYAVADEPVYYLSDIHGEGALLESVLKHIRQRKAVTVICGDLASPSDDLPPDVATLKAYLSACGHEELFTKLAEAERLIEGNTLIGGGGSVECLKEFKKYAATLGIEKRYVDMAGSQNVGEQIEFFRRLFNRMPVKDILAVDSAHEACSDSLMNKYLAMHPEILFLKNMGILVRHILPYPRVKYFDPNKPEKTGEFLMASKTASLFPPGLDNMVIDRERDKKSFDDLFLFRRGGRKAVKLAVVGHCHPEKPILFKRMEDGAWIGEVVTAGKEVKVTGQSVLMVPALKDAYRKAYIPYTRHDGGGELIVGCDAAEVKPKKEIREFALEAGLINAESLTDEQEDRIYRLIEQTQMIRQYLYLHFGKPEDVDKNFDRTALRGCFVRGALWDEAYDEETFLYRDFVQDMMSAVIKDQGLDEGSVDLKKLVDGFRPILKRNEPAPGYDPWSAGKAITTEHWASVGSLSGDFAVEELERLITNLRDLTGYVKATHPIPDGSKILISENLFDPHDAANLRRVLGEESNIKIESPKGISAAVVNPKYNESNLVCVMGRFDYGDIELWNKCYGDSLNGAKMIVINEDLKGDQFIYVAGIVGLSRAIMAKDKLLISRYLYLMFDMRGGAGIDLAGLTELILENPVGFADKVKFKRIEPIDSEEIMNRFKGQAESMVAA